jgi:hypothetical protein
MQINVTNKEKRIANPHITNINGSGIHLLLFSLSSRSTRRIFTHIQGTKEHVSFVTIKLTFETEYKILFSPKLQIKVNIIIHIKHHQATLTSLLIKLTKQSPTPN